MSLIKCNCCAAPAEPHKTVLCSICRKNFKIDCVDITNAEARKIHSNTGFSWSCKLCASVGNDLNSLKAAIVSLREEIQSLKSAVNTPVESALSMIDTEKIIQEISDRESRKTNVILYNSIETGNSKNEQLALDVAQINEICTAAELNVSDFQVHRLGKLDLTNTTRRRPIKIKFASEASASSLLRKSTQIKSVDKWSSLGLSRDRTVMQRELYSNVRTQMRERMDAGERNLRIKYRNGIPNIVSSEN